MGKTTSGKKSQEQKVLQYIKQRGSITTLDAVMDLGVHRLSARIYDLRQMGHNIVSEKVEVKNRFGEKCIVASYRLKRRKAA